MIWGFALVWPYQWDDWDTDPFMVRLMALRKYGLRHFMTGLGDWSKMDSERFARLTDFMGEHELGATLGFRTDFFGDLRAAQDDLARQIDAFAEIAPKVHAPIATTGVASTHRWDPALPLDFQMDRLAELLAPVAAACAALNRPLGIENHGDYYVSDLVGLCERAPGLGIFLDTGNPYLVGEKPLAAAREAAPYVVGGHFKDHVVAPVANDGPLRFSIGAATLGTGHVPLREIFHVLKADCPRFERVAMQIELIPPSFAGMDNVISFEESVAFVKSLEAGA